MWSVVHAVLWLRHPLILGGALVYAVYKLAGNAGKTRVRQTPDYFPSTWTQGWIPTGQPF